MRMRAFIATGATLLIVGSAMTGAASAAPPPPPPPPGPIIATSDLDNGGRPCSTTTDPALVLGFFANTLEALGTDSSPSPIAQYTFAIWPVDDPAAETDIFDTAFDGELGRATVPSGVEVSGGTYAWRAQMTDDNGTSPWSTTCVFTYDGTDPPAPTISSPNFPPYPQGIGPVGQLAQFTFSGGGDPDVAGFLYGWGPDLPLPACEYGGPAGQLVCPDVLSQPGVVRADAPGGTSAVSLPPPAVGPQQLNVRAMDAAGNLSSQVSYTIFVPASDPTITLLSPSPACGSQIQVAFTPNPGVSGVVSYTYTTNFGAPVSVAADSSGTAKVKIAVTSSFLSASSLSANGFRSSDGFLRIDVNPQPTVSASIYVNSGQPVGGVGIADTFTFTPPFDGISVSGYRYQFTGGPSGVAPADQNTQTGSLVWAPTRAGPQTLTVSSINTDGSGTSCPIAYSFTVANGHH